MLAQPVSIRPAANNVSKTVILIFII